MNVRFDYPVGQHDLEKVSQSYMKLFIEAGHTVLLHPMVMMTVEQSLGREGLDVITPDEPNWDVIIDHLQYMEIPQPEKHDKPVFLLSSFLADSIPEAWVEAVQHAAGIIVPSEAIAEAYRKVEGANVLAIPMPVFPERVLEPEAGLPSELIGHNYAVAVGMGHELDNLELTIRSYYEAEVAETAGLLAVYVANPIGGYPGAVLDAVSQVKEELNFRSNKYPQLRVYDGSEEYGAQRLLTDNCRAMVVMSMADTWGLGIHAALATGRPVITSGMKLELNDLPLVETSESRVKDCPEFGLAPGSMNWEWPVAVDIGAKLKELLYTVEAFEKYSAKSKETYNWINDRFKSDSERLDTWITEGEAEYVSSHTTNEPEVG